MKSQLYLRMITCAYAHHDLSLTTLKKLSELFGVDCPASLSPPGSH